MFESDSDHLFKDSNFDGVFDVIDLQAVDIALKRLGEVVTESIREKGEDACVMIEFSRNNYEHAFTLFDSKLLAGAYYLYLQTPIETCKERVRDRAAHQVYEDDYPVSKFIFEKYYHSDDGKHLPGILSKYGVDEQHILSLPNNDSFEAIRPEIQKFVASALLEESDEKGLTERAFSAV